MKTQLIAALSIAGILGTASTAMAVNANVLTNRDPAAIGNATDSLLPDPLDKDDALPVVATTTAPSVTVTDEDSELNDSDTDDLVTPAVPAIPEESPAVPAVPAEEEQAEHSDGDIDDEIPLSTGEANHHVEGHVGDKDHHEAEDDD